MCHTILYTLLHFGFFKPLPSLLTPLKQTPTQPTTASTMPYPIKTHHTTFMSHLPHITPHLIPPHHTPPYLTQSHHTLSCHTTLHHLKAQDTQPHYTPTNPTKSDHITHLTLLYHINSTFPAKAQPTTSGHFTRLHHVSPNAPISLAPYTTPNLQLS